MNDKVKEYGLLALIGASLIGAFAIMRGCDKRIDKNVEAPVLAPGVKEKIIVNPVTHKLSIVTSKGVQKMFLPDRPSSIELTDKGAVVIQDRQHGTEISSTLGFAYSDTARLALGVSFAYWDRWELGFSIYPSVSGSKLSVRFGPTLNYVVYDNTSLFVGVVDGLAPIGGISLKF